MIFLTFLTAIALSAVAGYYSVIGLASIFPGSFWPVIFMGSVLEGSKLVTVSWLYNNWKQCPFLIKSYLAIAVTILMLITSMGIFGFLSKAHLENSADNAPLVNKISILDDKIKDEKENIDANRKILKQYDEIVDQTMGRTTDEKGTDKAQAIRRSQQKDRSRIFQEIQQSQTTIAKYSEERSPLSNELKKTEADFGPIKYIAALLYSEEINGDVIDKAVRVVILLIIVVFDPLAILLLIAANMSMKQKESYEEGKKFYNNVTDKGLHEQSTPAHVEPKVEPKKEETVEIRKDNMIVIDDATGETIPPITTSMVEVHLTPGMHEEHHVPIGESVKKLEPKYDYDEPFSFKEKNVRDAGKF
jgi:hypothetical protein